MTIMKQGNYALGNVGADTISGSVRLGFAKGLAGFNLEGAPGCNGPVFTPLPPGA